ncbi:MAG: PQQ-like beta-propeller repeat protein [Bacteroidetes bacterium]|nr:PQQ-like beta-propeller repeat protein [Bacteroidota bacterium]
MKIKVSLCLAVLLFTAASVFSQTPTKWRGPEENGIYPDKGLLKVWPATGPEVTWTFNELGQGHSSPVIVGNNIFVTGMIGDMGTLFKLSLKGDVIWKVSYGKEFTESYPGPRSCPVIVGDQLYILTSVGQLLCLKTSDGAKIWSKDLFKDFDGSQITWGLNETVVIDGNTLYCTPGGKTNNVIALNRMNGELLWTSPGMGNKSAYCTPLLAKLAKRKILVTMTASNILGIDAATGKLLWNYEQTNQWSVHANTPLYADGGLFCFSGYGKGGVKLKLNDDGTTISKEWFSTTLDSRIGGAVVVNGYIYSSGDVNRAWQCVDWKTGEQKYASTELTKGNVIYADGMLYCYSEKGDLALVAADPTGFKIISKTKVTAGSDQHWAHPVISNGILYLRHGKSLIAYKIK